MASTASRNCRYAQSHATARPIRDELAANAGACASFYLDTVEGMSNDFLSTEGEDHHQGLARSHRLATDEQHPSDVEFLPDVEDVDAGYLLVIEEVVEKRVAVYRWSPSEGLVLHDHVFHGFPASSPTMRCARRTERSSTPATAPTSYSSTAWAPATISELPAATGAGAAHAGGGRRPVPLLQARSDVRVRLRARRHVPVPVRQSTGASQVKLVRDSEDKWFLLAFRSDPPDDPNGTDYVDLYGVRFEPFAISYRLHTVHLTFKPGDTGFASTGTRYVEPSGRLLVSSSYRWSKNERPGGAGYVSRVDELPSS